MQATAEAAEARTWRLAATAIALYFAAMTLARTATPGGLGLDEAELTLAAQSLDWGYGPQPPLYAWIHWLATQALGETKLAHAAVKNALLAAACLGFGVAARWGGGGPAAAATAALGLIFMPAFSWEAQRALTHTPMAVAAAAWACALLVRGSRPGSGVGDAIAFGAMLGLGLLAKANFGLLLVGLLAGAALVWPRRGRLILSIGVAAALVAPTVLWTVANPDAALSQAGEVASGAGPALFAAPALGEVALELLALGALPAAGFAAAVWRRPGSTGAADPRARRAVTTALLVAAGLAATGAALFGAEEVKSRWLLPVAAPLPLVLALALAPRIDAIAARRFGLGAAALALAAAAGLQINWRSCDGYMAAPFETLAARVGESGTRVLAADDWVGGSLLFHEPGLTVVAPKAPALGVRMEAADQLVWRGPSEAPPERLVRLHERRFGAAPRLGPVETLTAECGPQRGGLVLKRADVLH